jgi:hypothetical protein
VQPVTLVRIDIRCKLHREVKSDCGACCFFRKFEMKFEKLRRRRAELIRQLCGELRSGEVIPSVSGVRKHLEHIFQKLGVESRTAVAARALDVSGGLWPPTPAS